MGIPNGRPPTARELAAQSNGQGGYNCPRCGAVEWRGELRSSVESTRHPDGTTTIRRRRICQCGQYTFTTYETIVPEGCELKVVPNEEDEEAVAA